jgi:hypothetical protein
MKGWTMKRRFSDEQIIGMIKEYEAGVGAYALCNAVPFGKGYRE